MIQAIQNPSSMDTNFDMIYVGEPCDDIKLALQIAENGHFGSPSSSM
jgi:hypothetical protein